MGRVNDITPKKCAVIIAYEKDRFSQREIARKIGVCQGTVSKIVQRHRETAGFGRQRDIERQPRVTTMQSEDW